MFECNNLNVCSFQFIPVKLKNNATKADSILAQTEAPMYMSKDVSGEKFDGR